MASEVADDASVDVFSIGYRRIAVVMCSEVESAGITDRLFASCVGSETKFSPLAWLRSAHSPSTCMGGLGGRDFTVGDGEMTSFSVDIPRSYGFDLNCKIFADI